MRQLANLGSIILLCLSAGCVAVQKNAVEVRQSSPKTPSVSNSLNDASSTVISTTGKPTRGPKTTSVNADAVVGASAASPNSDAPSVPRIRYISKDFPGHAEVVLEERTLVGTSNTTLRTESSTRSLSSQSLAAAARPIRTVDLGDIELKVAETSNLNQPSKLVPAAADSTSVESSSANVIACAAPIESIAIEADDRIDSAFPASLSQPTSIPLAESLAVSQESPAVPLNAVQMNLPSVLATIDGRHPIVGFAQWRVREAYAEFLQAKTLWLPSIRVGFGFHRHDGNYQASNGQIVDVDRNSFQYGLGVGATGAGTTAQPGLLAQFHLAEAIFQPKVTQKTAWARGHAANAARNRQLMTSAVAYYELVNAYQSKQILNESRSRLQGLAKITSDFAEAGEGLQSDADRVKTEVALIDGRVISADEQISVSSAHLARALSIDASCSIIPMDVNALPIHLLTATGDRGSLIGTALRTRPELKESQALVSAACDAYQQEKMAPFVPSVLLGFSTGGFGGGLNNSLANVDDRYDFDALMSWQLRNLGFGEKAARQRRTAQIQQAKYAKLRVMDDVAADVNEAAAQVEYRQRLLGVTQSAIASARDSYERNLERIRDGQGLPIEVLQSVQALEVSQQAYLDAVIAYNQAQLRLQWALGWPVNAGL